MVQDLDAFFAEQDAISAMPSETVDEYLSRLSTQPPRRMNWANGISNDAIVRGIDQGLAPAAPIARNHESTVVMEDSEHEDRRWHRDLNKASDLDLSRYQMKLVLDVPRRNSPTSAGLASNLISASQSQSEGISTFSPRVEKRKSDSQTGSPPNKRRMLSSHASAAQSTESEPQSPILSFSKTDARNPKPAKRVVVDQGPPLPLLPITKAVGKAGRKQGSKPQATPSRRSTGPDSDIELSPPAESHKVKSKRAVHSEPSSDMLELKQRVSRSVKTVPLAKSEPGIVGSVAKRDESSIIHPSSSPSSREASPAPKKRKVQAPVEKGKPRPSTSRTTLRTKKAKPEPLTPFQYAEQLVSGKIDPGPRRSSVFCGYNIFYTGGDMSTATESTRNRMKLLIRDGANLISRYDPATVTHIVTETSERATVNALGVKRLSEVPEHIPVIRWSWVTYGMSFRRDISPKDADRKLRKILYNHAAFSERIPHIDFIPDSPPRKGKGKEKAKTLDEQELSHISEFTQDPIQKSASAEATTSAAVPSVLPDEPPSVVPSPSRAPEMGRRASSPLSLNELSWDEIYERAKVEAENDNGFVSAPSSDVEDVVPPPSNGKAPKSRWLADSKEVAITNCANQDVIDKLGLDIEAFIQPPAIRALKHHPTRIKSYEEAKAIKGIGDKTAKKAKILETGDLRRIRYERTEDIKVVQLFQGIYNVGGHIARKWYANGCRTLDDLRARKGGVKLSHINERMPRSEAEAIYSLIEPIALSLDPKLFIRIMGSFRRGKETCGDIDILITRPEDDGKTHAGLLPRLLEALHKAGILTEDLATPDDPYDLEATYRGLCHIPTDPNSKRRRIDILAIPWKQRGGALLYYTGDDIFNRALRYKAGALGYSLNQRGLYGGVVRDPHQRTVKLNNGFLVASETEEEIFKILGVPWQEPHERVR
ncbi:hypothetical protein D9611_010000 [Ephemerocybe angulata]|uniref:DNA-directed DNA polymerase n=1 Tax=Ephemerocybe angulata TaxID=980116 RepID=A0A8H5C695_9AGAR|nr:hypothetical protein D9611_010000 [Tulosesus angulatus]